MKKKTKVKQSSKRKMSKTMEMNPVVQLDRESFYKVKEMLSSSDKENHVVALGILEQMDAKENMPYMLLLYKQFKDISTEGWNKVKPKMEKALKAMGKGDLSDVTYNSLYNKVKGSWSKEALQLVLDEFGQELKFQVTSWGFTFLPDADLKLTLK